MAEDFDDGGGRASALAAIVAASPLFDANWYRDRYLRDAPGDDSVSHYLTAGPASLADPGPAFSSGWYLLTHADVEATGGDPLVHFEKHGRAEARTIQPSDDVDRRPLLDLVRFVRDSGAVAAAWYGERYPNADRPDPVLHYLESGWRDGCDPSPDFSTRSYLDANPDVAASGANPLVHYLRHGRAEGRPLMPEATGASAAERTPMATLRFGESRVRLAEPVGADCVAAFAALAVAKRGCAPVEVEAFAADGTPIAPGQAPMVEVGASIAGLPLTLDDAWYADATIVRLRLASTTTGGLAGWQRVADRLVQVGSCELAIGTVIANLSLIDPLGAVVLAVTTDDGDVNGAGIVVHPSRLRGGLHAAEALVDRLAATISPSSTDARDEDAVGTVVVDRDDTTLSIGVARWIVDTFGVVVVEADEERSVIATPDRANGGAFDLRLPRSSVPTIGALAGVVANANGGVSPIRWITTNPNHPAEIAVVAVPADPVGTSGGFPAITRRATRAPGVLAGPSVIMSMPPSSASSGMAWASGDDVGAVTVVVDCSGDVDTVALLASIALQEGIGRIDLVLLGAPEDALARQAADRFPGFRIAAAGDGRAAAVDCVAAGAGPVVVLLDGTVRLPDPNTIAVLAAMVVGDGVATAGCPVRGANDEGGALIAVRVETSSFVLRQMPVGHHAGGLTVPVVAVSPGICAYSTAALQALGGLAAAHDERPETAFALRAIDAGYRNLFTARVAAWREGSTTPPVDQDLAGLPVGQRDRLLATTMCLDVL